MALVCKDSGGEGGLGEGRVEGGRAFEGMGRVGRGGSAAECCEKVRRVLLYGA